jgi:glutamine amidotransferase
MTARVAIIDSGGANIASLVFAFERLGAASTVTRDHAVIRNASHVILPGVGAASDAMSRLRGHGLDELIGSLTQPVLGICLGMQLLAEHSDEDDAACIGVIPGNSRKLPASPDTPVPNMGWCAIEDVVDHPLLDGIDAGAWFYFVHSYALGPEDYTIATARHSLPFTAVLARDNFCATQFHPERSSASGARLLENFLRLGA